MLVQLHNNPDISGKKLKMLLDLRHQHQLSDVCFKLTRLMKINDKRLHLKVSRTHFWYQIHFCDCWKMHSHENTITSIWLLCCIYIPVKQKFLCFWWCWFLPQFMDLVIYLHYQWYKPLRPIGYSGRKSFSTKILRFPIGNWEWRTDDCFIELKNNQQC